MKKWFFALCVLLTTNVFATTYYVSTTGNDANAGTSISASFLTIAKAVSKAIAGDIIYVRGGRYFITAKINLAKNGTATSRITLAGYPGDSRPIIDGSNMATSTSNRGIEVNGSYWTIKGLDIYNAGDNGMHISGANNIIDQCNFYENRDTGCQLSNGAANNQIINCDSYYNRDSTSATNYDGNADGFAAKLDVGTGNSFKGCRAWQNSDDGWDGLLTAGSGLNPVTTYDSCWCFMNGYRKSGVASTGNGNGFKMGGNNETHDATLTHCLSAYNRVKGFDQNNNNGSMTLYNCTGYKNKPNFGMNNNDPNAGKVMIVKNCVSLSSGSTDVFRAVCVRTNNSWQSPVTTTTADFVSVDSTGLRNPRKADGSLPDINFMHLAQGSDLIDAGTNVGLVYNGNNPDIGCFESNYPVPLKFLGYELKLTAADKNNSVENLWQTANEINVSHFNIQRSINGKDFITIAQVKASNKSYNDYSFTDNNFFATNQLYYRIVSVDNDGKLSFSEIKAINIRQATNISIYPNPAKSTVLNIAINKFTGTNCSVTIANILGKQVVQQNVNSATTALNISHLPKGIYFVTIATNEAKTVSKLIVE